MDATQRFVELGVPADRIISVAFRHLKELSLLEGSAEKIAVTTSLDPSVTDVVILCGGLGTRLGALTAQTPKPLLPVGRHPFLLRLLLNLESQGFVRFILAAHYLAEHFKELLSTYRDVLPNITLVVESAPLGTGGALRHALGHVHSSVFVALNGDSWVTQPLEPVLIDHLRAGRVFTVVAVPATNVEGGALNKGVWRVGPKGDVQGFATQGEVSEGWVNAGVYIFDRDLVSSWPSGSYSLEDNLPSLLKGKRTSVFCSTGRLLDIGTPESYERASRVLEPPDQLVSSMGSA